MEVVKLIILDKIKLFVTHSSFDTCQGSTAAKTFSVTVEELSLN